MWPVVITIVFLLVAFLGVYWVIHSLHAEHLNSEKANAGAWKALALSLTADQRDAANRLLIRSGVMPAPQERQPPAETSIPHDDDDTVWSQADEQAEIDQKAREALGNPLQAELIEEAARYDPAWKPVWERLCELKRQVS
jgi:hypothetical protein